MAEADDLSATSALRGLDGRGAGGRFWAALADDRLELPWCGSCGRAFFYPRIMCPRCWSLDVGWRRSSGRGVLYAATEVRVPFQGLSAEALPLWIALVELDEGVRIPGQLDPATGAPETGARVEPVWGSTLPGPLVFGLTATGEGRA